MSSWDGNGAATQEAEARLHVDESGKEPAPGPSDPLKIDGAEQGGVGETLPYPYLRFSATAERLPRLVTKTWPLPGRIDLKLPQIQPIPRELCSVASW